MSMRNLRQAIADALQNDKGQTFNVYAKMPGRPVLPALVVAPSDDTVARPETSGGGWVWLMDVHVMLPYNDPEDTQDQLDDEVSPDIPDSTMHCLRRNSTLGNAVMDCTPINVMFYGTGEAGGAPYLGAQIRLEVREC